MSGAPPPLPVPPDGEPPQPLPAAAAPLPQPALLSVDHVLARRRQAEDEYREVGRLLAFYGAMLLPVLVVLAWSYHGGVTGLGPELWAGFALYTAILVSGVIWKENWLHLLVWPRAMDPRLIVLTVLTPFATLAGALCLLAGFAHVGFPIVDTTEEFTAAEWPSWAILAWIAVLPALFEEVAFRGIILSKLLRLTHPRQAIWVSSILFGVLHFNILGMAMFLVPLALVAAYLTRRTQSLVPAFFIHFTHNAGIVLFELTAW